jgi:hypothetical protein
MHWAMLCAVHVSTTTVTYIDPRCIHVSCLPTTNYLDIIIPHCLGCTCLSFGELVKTDLILYQVTELPGDKWHLHNYIYWPVMNRATHDQSQQWIIQVFLILPLLQTEPIWQTESKAKVMMDLSWKVMVLDIQVGSRLLTHPDDDIWKSQFLEIYIKICACETVLPLSLARNHHVMRSPVQSSPSSTVPLKGSVSYLRSDDLHAHDLHLQGLARDSTVLRVQYIDDINTKKKQKL